MPETAPRPGHATLAGWLVIGGSVILVLVAWQRIANLHTLEVQEELQRAASNSSVDLWTMSAERLETIIRVLCMIAAGAATASAILGWYALKRSTSARLAITLLTPLLVVGAFATASGFSGSLVLLGIVMLWLRPTRDWYAGRPWTTQTAGSAQRRPDPFAPTSQPRPVDAAPPTPEPPPPTPEPEPAPGPGPVQPGPFVGEYGAPAPTPATSPSPEVRAKRPGALIAACVTVWASCALVAGFMLLFSLVMTVARDEFFEELQRQQPDDVQGITAAQLATGTYLATAFIVLWCVAATVLAMLAFRRLQWARVALVTCAGVAGLVLLAATFISPPVGVLLVASLVTVWLLLRADVTAWFMPRDRR